MKRKIFLISMIGMLGVFVAGCDKNGNSNPTTGFVELYLLDSYKTVGNTNQIDESSIVTKANPLVAYSDILSYDSSNYTFKISDKAKTAIKNTNHSVHGIAFAIKANNVLIYSGYFWPSYSSASCDWVVIDPIMVDINNELKVEMGYPGLLPEGTIPDKRNDQRILDIFESDHKLSK
ncbi:MAG: hypothetical protein ABFC28_02925 [Rikenellaceae bacterium]